MPSTAHSVCTTPVRDVRKSVSASRDAGNDFLSPGVRRSSADRSSPGASSSDCKACNAKIYREQIDRYPQEVCDAFGVSSLDEIVREIKKEFFENRSQNIFENFDFRFKK